MHLHLQLFGLGCLQYYSIYHYYLVNNMQVDKYFYSIQFRAEIYLKYLWWTVKFWDYLHFLLDLIFIILFLCLYIYRLLMQNSKIQKTDKNQLPGLGKIYAGEVHFSRIPVQYWEHRILMIKAMGLNALSIYIMWNYHEISKGYFDFSTDNKNLPLFLDLAQKHNMMVLFRPGPYVCAEWDFGGMPARLLSIDGLVIRANNAKFLQETRIYFQALVPIMKKYLRSKQNPKGCIVMLQIENQYGFYGTDKTYIEAIRKMWKDFGISTHQYYVDWPLFIARCHWEGANIGINHFDGKLQEMRVRWMEKQGIIMGGEIYTGWMTHWTEKWGGKGTDKVVGYFKFLLQNGNSFAMYMAHGGTNFGLTAGANGLNFKTSDYWGAITSYDYDAPINEQGSVTPKYLQLRKLFQKHVKWQIPQIPDPIPMITIHQIRVTKTSRLFDNMPQPIQGDAPYHFQTDELKMFNQGIVVYQAIIPNLNRDIYIKMVVHDFALVFLGDKLIQVLDRTKQTNHGFTITKANFAENGQRLRVLVQAGGHINFDHNMETDRKGLYYFGGDVPNLVWSMYRFPVQFQVISKWKETFNEHIMGKQDGNQHYIKQDFPVLLKGKFELSAVGDVYLDVSTYGRGYMWVNGRNLGRYWNAGPQTRLFCPGVWLNKGSNVVHILNVWGSCGISIQGFDKLKDPSIQVEESTCDIM